MSVPWERVSTEAWYRKSNSQLQEAHRICGAPHTKGEASPHQYVLEGWTVQSPRARSGPTLTTCQSLSVLLLICMGKLSRYVLQKAEQFSL